MLQPIDKKKKEKKREIWDRREQIAWRNMISRVSETVFWSDLYIAGDMELGPVEAHWWLQKKLTYF